MSRDAPIQQLMFNPSSYDLGGPNFGVGKLENLLLQGATPDQIRDISKKANVVGTKVQQYLDGVPAFPTLDSVFADWNRLAFKEYGTYVDMRITSEGDIKAQIERLKPEVERQQQEWIAKYGNTPEAQAIRREPVPTWQSVYNKWQPLYQKQYGAQLLNRPWYADQDAINQKAALDREYINALNDYNQRYGTNFQPSSSTLGKTAQPNLFATPDPGKRGIDKAISQVGDVFRDIGDALENTFNAVLENPEIILIAVAAPQILPTLGVPAVAVQPVTAALVTASQGGDLEDIGKSALAAYAAPQVGSVVGQEVAAATAGSDLQNVLTSAAAGGATGATSAAITGGDIGESAILGAAGSAGASIGREVAAATEYDVPIFSEQSRQLISQDVGLNRAAELGADISSALGRAAITGDIEGELAGAVNAASSREVADLLRSAFASSTDGDEVRRAEQAIAAELESNPAFAEQIQLAQIAAGDEVLTTDQKIDALAESVARDAFAQAVDGGEQVAALPAIALPVAANVARQAAINSAPEVVRRIAQFAANDPRFAQVMITNPYVQQLLAASGLTMTVSLSGDVSVNTIPMPDQSAAETARLNRYASEIVKTVPNANPENVRQLEQTAAQSEAPAAREELVQRQAELERLADQGFPVQRELQRIELELQRPIPTIDVTEIPRQAGAVPPPTIDIRATPVTRPGTVARPGTAPEVAPLPRPGEELAPEVEPVTAPSARPSTRPGEEAAPATEPAPSPSPRPVTRLEPAPKQPTRPGGGPRLPVPLEIESLFTDEDILDFIREGLGDDFVTGTTEAADVGEAGEGSVRPTVDVRPSVVGRTRETPYQSSVSGRSVASGPSAITGMKEPTFGGDPGQQQDVWNVRSLRLRKALGL